jgi:hypothetical protein
MKEDNLKEEYEKEYELEDDEEEEELSVTDAIEEITYELFSQSESLEELVSIQRERLEGEKKFQEQLLNLLEKLVNK